MNGYETPLQNESSYFDQDNSWNNYINSNYDASSNLNYWQNDSTRQYCFEQESNYSPDYDQYLMEYESKPAFQYENTTPVLKRGPDNESVHFLKTWLGDHRDSPYPTKDEKIMLAIITKMTVTQISTWFANARRRLKQKNQMTWVPKHGCKSTPARAKREINP